MLFFWFYNYTYNIKKTDTKLEGVSNMKNNIKKYLLLLASWVFWLFL